MIFGQCRLSPLMLSIILVSGVLTYIYKYNKLFLLIIGCLFLFLWFHRAPTQPVLLWNGEIRSPAYGYIKRIITTGDKHYIVIILNIFDVHIQYYPVAGKLLNRVHDKTGKFHLAMKLDKSDSNEKVISTIQSDNNDIIRVTQIAGMLPHVIISDTLKVGDRFNVGDEMGMIRFGSRVDIELPSSYILNVKEGDKVNGPRSILAL